jgi:hypothetical protein
MSPLLSQARSLPADSRPKEKKHKKIETKKAGHSTSVQTDAEAATVSCPFLSFS